LLQTSSSPAAAAAFVQSSCSASKDCLPQLVCCIVSIVRRCSHCLVALWLLLRCLSSRDRLLSTPDSFDPHLSILYTSPSMHSHTTTAAVIVCLLFLCLPHVCEKKLHSWSSAATTACRR
jgi:hypothetical protein